MCAVIQNKQRVLIVDDEPLIIAILEKALQSFVEVIPAETGKQALDIARSTPAPDLILLDVGLPDMDGHAVCGLLKSHPSTADIPVIFTTAHDLAEDETSGFEAGATDYITKPLNIPVTIARIRAHLETRRLHHEIQRQNHQLDRLVRQRTQALENEMNIRREGEKRVLYRAHHDELTGLPLISLQRKAVANIVSTSPGKLFALALIMLDGFQEINNTLGHQHANKLLEQLSLNLSQAAREINGVLNVEYEYENKDEVGYLTRLDGVTFTLAFECPGGEQAAIEEISKLLSVLEQPVDYLGMSLNFGASIGLAMSPRHGSDMDTLLRHSHIAHEQAQQKIPHVAMYTEEMNPYSERRLALMGELRNAINENNLALFYQPQVDLKTKRVSSLEALLRWQHPEFGFISPIEFIPLAEKTGIIKPLTEWVLNEALRQSVVFDRHGYTLNISINISARNLREANLVGMILTALKQHGVKPERLVLELTETAVMENPQEAHHTLQQLNDAGLQISIDDFGTGYSSLSHLRHLPVSEVKIDRSFIMEMMSKPDDRVLVKTVIDMARNLDLRVVAEGVEDAATLVALDDMGCDVAQGFHLCRPIAADDLLNWLKQYGTTANV